MNYKKEISVLSSILVLSFILGLIVLCKPDSNYICRGVYQETGFSVWFLSIVSLFSLIPLFFLKEAVYKTWRLFAVIAFPIMLALIFLTPIHAQSMLGIDREYVTLLTTGIFFTASLGIMIYKTIKLRK